MADDYFANDLTPDISGAPGVVEKVHESVSNNLYPQGPTFHWKDGWLFARGESNCVHVWNTDRGVELVIPSAEWESIITSLKQ